MNKQCQDLCEEVLEQIKKSYEQGVGLEEAERLAGKFLYAQMLVTNELAATDLDARMKKSGVKAIKAGVYLAEAKKTDKKPSDVMLSAIVDQDQLVANAQEQFDNAEVTRDRLQNYLNIFKESHIHFRTIAKGSFNG